MLEGLERLDFGFDEVDEDVVVVEDLDGVAGAGGVLGELDFAGDALAECLTDLVLPASGWHFK